MKRSRCLARLMAALWVGSASVACLVPLRTPAAEDVFRVGFSQGAIGQLSQNDALAALKGWALGIARSRGLDVDVSVRFFENSERISAELAAGGIHAAALSTEEILENGIHPDRVLVQVRNGTWKTRYSVLVRNDAGISSLGDFKSGTIAVHRRAGSGLGELWLSHEMRGLGAGFSVDRLVPQSNGTKAVLRVFFRQDAACLIESVAFDIACELNPQLRKDLRVLVVSPDFVPQAFFYLPEFKGPLRESIENAVQGLHETVAGRQVMHVFQGERMEDQPFSVLDSTLQFIKTARPELVRPKEKTE